MNDILDEIIAFSFPPKLEEGEFTRTDYSDRCNALGLPAVSYDFVVNQLERMIREGLLTKREVFHRSKRTWAYKPTEKFNEQVS